MVINEKKEHTYQSITKELLAQPWNSHCIGNREFIYQRASEIEI